MNLKDGGTIEGSRAAVKGNPFTRSRVVGWRYAVEMSAQRLVPVLFLVLLGAGCGGEDEHVTDGPVADARDPDAFVDAGDDAGSERHCGGITGEQCLAGEYCDFPTNTCGAGDEQGLCRPRPVACPDNLVAVPTCACDGMIYGQDCDVYAAGSDLNALGGCPVAEGMFVCGYTQCSLTTQYCQRQPSDVADHPDTFTCQPLPGCPSEHPTCACLANEACGASCSGAGATGLTLTCPGG
jgi:hypothetical protein